MSWSLLMLWLCHCLRRTVIFLDIFMVEAEDDEHDRDNSTRRNAQDVLKLTEDIAGSL